MERTTTNSIVKRPCSVAPTPSALDQIRLRKEEVRRQIAAQQQEIHACFRELVGDGRRSTRLFTFKNALKWVGTTVYGIRLVRSVSRVTGFLSRK